MRREGDDIAGDRADRPRAGRALFAFDPGWLFLIAGCVLIAATVLIPANEDLRLARWYRDNALAAERWHAQRLERYASYLDELDHPDPTMLRSLAITQLNMLPASEQAVIAQVDASERSASVFPDLDPAFTPPPPLTPIESRLQRLTSDRDTRLWLLAGGAMAILIGLLPATRASAGPAAAAS